MPEDIENDDSFDGRNVNQLSVDFQPDDLMQVPRRPTKHHLAQADL